ncbi:hypothetical protein HDU82_006859 [Entophlyctis luteolus]|nr:hypothetical protein HDU82_006859 [Entophlyctis luteolus]
MTRSTPGAASKKGANAAAASTPARRLGDNAAATTASAAGVAVTEQKAAAEVDADANDEAKRLDADVAAAAVAAAAFSTTRVVDRTFLDAPADTIRLLRADRVLKQNASMPLLNDDALHDDHSDNLRHSLFEFESIRDADMAVEKPARDAGVPKNIPMSDDLQRALALRERRQTRRKMRLLGVPPDPNDSDDSLLAELNDATDEKLFPGLYERQQQEKSAYFIFPAIVTVYDSEFAENELKLETEQSIRLNLKLIKKKLKHYQKQQQQASSKIEENPRRLLASLTPRTTKVLEALVLERKNSQSAATSLKSVASQKIDRIKKALSQTIMPDTLDSEQECTSELHNQGNISNEDVKQSDPHEEATQENLNRLERLMTILECDVAQEMEALLLKRLRRSKKSKSAALLLRSSTQSKTDSAPSLPVPPKEHQQESASVLAKNLAELKATANNIRKALAERQAARALLRDDDSKFPHGLIDLSESFAVRETRLKILNRQQEADKLEAERRKKQNAKEAMIHKHISEMHEKERREHEQLRVERQSQKILEGLAPPVSSAFPLVKLTSPKVHLVLPKPIGNIQTEGIEALCDFPKKTERRHLPPPNHKVESKPAFDGQKVIGVPFKPDPQMVVFRDYEPQAVYSKTVKITNTSCRVNTFRLVPLSVELATYFEVLAPPPGMMSAGMDCEVIFVFRPPQGYDQDIENGEVEFEAEYGGKFTVRLGCAAKKCRPRISQVTGTGMLPERVPENPSQKPAGHHRRVCEFTNDNEATVDFGACVRGGLVTRTIELFNDGALSTDVTLSEITNESSPKGAFTVKCRHGAIAIGGYSSLKIPVQFKPQKLVKNSNTDNEQAHASFHVTFNSPGIGPLVLRCRGEILMSPLQVDRTAIDFGTCVTECYYGETIVVKNCSGAALRFWISIVGMSKVSDNPPFARARTPASCESAEFGSNKCTDGVDSNIGKASEPVTNTAPERQTRKSAECCLPSKDGLVMHSSKGVLGSPVSMNCLSSNMFLTSSIDVRPSSGGRQQFAITPMAASEENGGNRTDVLLVNVANMGELEVLPSVAIVQPFDKAKVLVKIKPSRSGHLVLNNGMNPYTVNLKVKYLNQGVETKIPLAISGRVTTSDISFSIPASNNDSSQTLVFGHCALSEAKEIQLKITNKSRLAQKVRFVSTHPSIRVVFKPGEDIRGVVPLEPESYQIRSVRFEPMEIGIVNASLSCVSAWNRNFELKCSGVGFKTRSFFENSEVRFGSIAIGSSQQTNVQLRCHGTSDATFGPVNLSAVKSVVKQTWSKDKVEKEPNGSQSKIHEINLFEFGAPRIVGVFSRKSLAKLASDHTGRTLTVKKKSKSIIKQAEEAVKRTEPNLLKTFRVGDQGKSDATAFDPKDCVVDDLFSSHRAIVANPRIIIPSDEEIYLDESESKFPAISLQDAAPLLVTPSAGRLGPDMAVEVRIEASIPHLEKLAVWRNIQQMTADAAMLPATNEGEISAVPDEPVPAAVEKKEEKTKGNESKVSLIEASSTREPVIYPEFAKKASPSPSNDVGRPKICDFFNSIDDTCVIVLLPCKLVRKLTRQSSTSEKETKELETIYIRVVMPIVKPDIMILHPVSQSLDFGHIPLGQETKLSFDVINCSSAPSTILNFRLLDDSAPYRTLNHTNLTVEPLASATFQVAFIPTGEGAFNTFAEVLTETSRACMVLNGEGIMPMVMLEPDEKSVFFGDVVVGEVVARTFKITNLNVHSLEYRIRLSKEVPAEGATHEVPLNRSGTRPFSVSPWYLEVDAQSSREFTVTFAADRESDAFHDTISVIVGDGSGADWVAAEVAVHGRCWEASSVLQGYARPAWTASEAGAPAAAGITRAAELWHVHKLLAGDFVVPLADAEDDSAAHDSAAASILSVSNATLKADSKTASTNKLAKKGGVPAAKEGAKPEAGDNTAEIARMMNHLNERFAVLECGWKQCSETPLWYVESKCLYITSLKPNNFVKPETKLPPTTDFTIEPWEQSFEYDEQQSEYVKVPAMQINPDERTVKFTADICKGSVEFGATRALTVKLVDLTQEFSTKLKQLQKAVRGDTTAHKENSEAVFAKPFRVESYFKLCLRGGMRYVDPKGLLSPSECRVWFLKVVAIPPE